MLNRRELLVGGAALVAGAGGVKLASSGDEVVGAGDEPRVRDDPDALDPPGTDAGQLPNLKFSFDAAHTRVTSGGWARQVTVRELPVAATIAGVKMHLKPGSIRELHWHAAGEWASGRSCSPAARA